MSGLTSAASPAVISVLHIVLAVDVTAHALFTQARLRLGHGLGSVYVIMAAAGHAAGPGLDRQELPVLVTIRSC